MCGKKQYPMPVVEVKIARANLSRIDPNSTVNEETNSKS